MITFEIVEVSVAGNTISEIVRTNADGTQSTIPADPSNKDYAEYLLYTEWVEAGNDPDEFWTRAGII